MATDPYEDLNRELATGQRLATELVHHLKRMGNAAAGTIPVEVDGRRYLVCVEEATEVRAKPASRN